VTDGRILALQSGRTRWVAVSGWIDPTRIEGLAVVGAASFDLYGPTGHVGIPSVPVALREDGHFLAPRVPLQDGATQLRVLGLAKGEVSAFTAIDVTGAQTGVAPVTLTVDPPFGNAPLPVKLAAHAATPTDAWQWDFEGDGNFDVEEKAPTHTYAKGTFGVMARTRVDGRWVYGLSPLVVSEPGAVSHHSAAVTAPRLISVVPTYSTVEPTSEMSHTRAVLVADGDTVKVFSPELVPGVTLTGLAQPSGLAGDELGRIYVSDTGHDQIVRFTPAGAIDTSFGDGGVLGGISRPGSLSYELQQVSYDDGSVKVLGWRLRVLDGRGHQLTFNSRDLKRPTDAPAPFDIRNGQGLTATSAVQPTYSDGSPQALGAWFAAAGVLYRPGMTGPEALPAIPGLRSFTVGTLPYWAAIDGKGKLHEWLDVRWNHRATDLDFGATAVAIDSAASHYLHLRGLAPGDLGAWSFGPVVLYVAGPGRIERRVTPLMRGWLQ
jgi:hypothetical protein